MKKLILSGWIVIVCAISPSPGFAQSANWPDQLNSGDSAAIYALVLYPDSLRLSIFEACKYPEAIVRTANLQEKTSNAFVDVIGGFSREVQEDLWDITRYPELVHALVAKGQPEDPELSVLAQSYPPEVQTKIMYYGHEYYGVFRQIDELYISSSKQFNDLLKGYSPVAIRAFNDLIAMPEVLNILNDHLQMTVLVGDLYKKDPAALIHTADSLNYVAVQQNAANVDAWKKMISEDAQAQADLKDAAREYASENGYTEDDYSTAPSQYYVEHYVCYSYPYWFGYPYWYPYYYWYPYPWWYDWGFYIDPWGNVVWLGPPSYYFTYWYFYYPHHYYQHPYIASMYVTYYYGPRHVTDENTNVVHDWVKGNREYLPDNFTADAGGRPEIIRDLGKFETDMQSHNLSNPQNPVSRDEFILNHEKEYPALNIPTKDQIKTEKERPVFYETPKTPPAKQPPVKINEPKKDEIKKPDNPQPKYDFNKVNKAQQYHKSVWGNTPGQQRPKPEVKQSPGKKTN